MREIPAGLGTRSVDVGGPGCLETVPEILHIGTMRPMKDAERPELSIGIVLYNSGQTLPGCLRSVREELDSGFAELIAVDNASPDDSVAILCAETPAAQLVVMEGNRGFAAGVNAALGRARGRYWLLLN